MTDVDWRGLLPESAVRAASGSVFHYTGANGLLGIAQRKEIWATEATGMNDVAEVRQGWDFIREWLAEGDSSGWVADEMREIAGLNDLDPHAYQHPARSVDGVFVCCASRRPDDANQWRLYASGGRGYCIELDAAVPLAALVEGSPHTERSDSRPPPGKRRIQVPPQAWVSPWLEVLYSDSAKHKALTGLAAQTTTLLDELDGRCARESWSSDDYYAERQMLSDTLASGLASLAQLMKSDGFSGENEVRAVASSSTMDISTFRATPHGVVRYARLTQLQDSEARARPVFDDGPTSNDTRSLPIRSVRLGPLIHAQNNRETVSALLRSNGFTACAINESALPLGR